MAPFRVILQPGISIAGQVIVAAKKAIFSGTLRPGDQFPSVRVLAREMKIHPNTAQKAIAQLASEGFLQVLPGIGTVVVQPPARHGPVRLLAREVEQLTIQAIQLGVSLEAVQAALADCWRGFAAKD